MTLKLLSGNAENVSQQGHKYRFSLGSEDIILTSKIDNCVGENDEMAVVGYYFRDEDEANILGTVAYFNFNSRAKSSNKIPLYVFIVSFFLNICLVVYAINLYLAGGMSYHIVLFIFLLSIAAFLGYMSTKAHLMLNAHLKEKHAQVE